LKKLRATVTNKNLRAKTKGTIAKLHAAVATKKLRAKVKGTVLNEV